jgi:monoamine oxidase
MFRGMTAALPAALDIAVIGAGAAGIAAARALAGHPVSVAVFEARDRIGGRAHTLSFQGHGLDMGCGWLHSADENPLAAMVEPAGFTLDKTPPPWERPAFDAELSAVERAEFRAAFAAFDARVDEAAARGEDGPASDQFEPDCRWNARMDVISGALNGARFAQVSTRDYAAYRDTGLNWRVREGYGRFIASLGASLAADLGDVPIVLDCPVSRIDRSGPTLRLETARGVVQARAVIVTVPTDLIGREILRFDPPLPDLVEAAANVPLGLASKMHMTVTKAEEFPVDCQVWGRADSTETGGYHFRPLGRPMIEGWFSADFARTLEAEGQAAFFAFSVEELVSILGSGMRKRLAPVAASMWGADPWALGAYSYVRPGHGGDRARLRAPIENRIFLAGEATSDIWQGAAHGAWIEGARAANEALAALGVAGPANEGVDA